MKRKLIIFLSILLILTLSFMNCGGGKKASVGAKNFTEQFIIGNMTALLLRDRGFQVEEKFGTGSTVTRKALSTGQTDLYAEYTGTAWTLYLDHEKKINDPTELYNKVAEEDLEKNNIKWVGRAPLNNTYALAIKQDDISKYGKTLSELADYVNNTDDELIFAIDHEFYDRPDGFPKMRETYNMEISQDQIKTMDVGLTFEAIDKGQVDVAMVFATDGKLKKYNLQVLKDNKNFFPIYNLSMCVRKEFLDKYPEIEDDLEKMLSFLDTKTMQDLNYRVDVNREDEKAVAKDFLMKNGLIESDEQY